MRKVTIWSTESKHDLALQEKKSVVQNPIPCYRFDTKPPHQQKDRTYLVGLMNPDFIVAERGSITATNRLVLLLALNFAAKPSRVV